MHYQSRELGYREEFMRRDGDPNRIAAFRDTMNYVQSKYWEKKFPKNYHLILLATHPDHRKRGAGSALSRWVIDQGLAAGVDIGVEASPMGFPLYQHLGFALQETLTVEPSHDDARLLVRVMVYQKNKDSSGVQTSGEATVVGKLLVTVGWPRG
jgi:GNAT superfamily N-acetyltransferase